MVDMVPVAGTPLQKGDEYYKESVYETDNQGVTLARTHLSKGYKFPKESEHAVYETDDQGVTLDILRVTKSISDKLASVRGLSLETDCSDSLSVSSTPVKAHKVRSKKQKSKRLLKESKQDYKDPWNTDEDSDILFCVTDRFYDSSTSESVTNYRMMKSDKKNPKKSVKKSLKEFISESKPTLSDSSDSESESEEEKMSRKLTKLKDKVSKNIQSKTTQNDPSTTAPRRSLRKQNSPSINEKSTKEKKKKVNPSTPKQLKIHDMSSSADEEVKSSQVPKTLSVNKSTSSESTSASDNEDSSTVTPTKSATPLKGRTPSQKREETRARRDEAGEHSLYMPEDDVSDYKLWLIKTQADVPITALPKQIVFNGIQDFSRNKKNYELLSFTDEVVQKGCLSLVQGEADSLKQGAQIHGQIQIVSKPKAPFKPVTASLITHKPVPFPSGLKVRFTPFGADEPEVKNERSPHKKHRKRKRKLSDIPAPVLETTEDSESSPKKKKKKKKKHKHSSE